MTVIRRAVKQRKDAIDQFTNAGRPELADGEKAELAILETYLPTMMSKEDIKKIALTKQTELSIPSGPAGKEKMGQFIGSLMKDLKGKADGADVKEVVESLFI